MSRREAGKTFGAALLFAAIWLLWSGHFKPLLLVLGAFSCALVSALAWRIGAIGIGGYAVRRPFALMRFWAWLLKQILRSNMVVAYSVLRPRPPIAPRLVCVETAGLSELAQATLANAITLTPGTLSLDINARTGRIEVHCLDQQSADDLRNGAMRRRVFELDL